MQGQNTVVLEKHISHYLAQNDVFSYVDFLENLYFLHQKRAIPNELKLLFF